jgi:hypothetical protein
VSVSDRISHARVEFRKVRIPHPQVERIRTELDTLRNVGRKTREEWEQRGRRGKRPRQKYLAIIAPSGCGKSTCVDDYLETVVANENHPERIVPAQYLELSPQATTKSLGSDILKAYDDPDFEEGTAVKLLRRSRNHIDRERTEVLVLDEFHHVIHNDGGGRTAWSVTETIKRMLNYGVCPIVLIGTEDAIPILVSNPQLVNRSYEPLVLRPLDVDVKEEWTTFCDHCAGFDLKLVEHRILPGLSGLVTGDIPACAYDVSGGIIGVASNLFEVAAEHALRRETGSDRITRDDLSAAVRNWAIPNKITDHDPFALGPRKLKPVKMKAAT